MIRKDLRALLTLALPLVLAQVAQTSMGFVDTLMVGRLGQAQLAAIALGSTLFHLLQIVLSGVIFAVSPLVSQAVGANDIYKAGRAVRQGLWLALLLFMVGSTVYWNAGPLLLGMGQDPATVVLSTSYLRAIAWGLLPALGVAALRGLLEGTGVTRPIMLISFVGVGFNVVANNALMFGHWGFPELGLVGTGYASSLSLGLIFVLTALYIASRQGRYGVFGGFRWPHLATLKELLRVGVPIGLTLGFEGGMFAATAFLMGLLGPAQLAAHQIALQTASITFMVPLGLALATTARVGQATGRGDRASAARAGFTGIAASAFFMCFTALTFWLAPRFIVGLYLDLSDPQNAEVVRLAQLFLGMAAMFQIFDGFQVSAAGALRGLKDTRVPMLITLVAYWVIGIGSAALFCFGLGFGGRGLWFGLVLGLGVAGVLLSLRFSRLVSRERVAVQEIETPGESKRVSAPLSPSSPTD